MSQCPPPSQIVYSPFEHVSQAAYTNYTGRTGNGACWWWAICVFEGADEARKQQFAATSLVMGLVPLTLKDIAWPERRVVVVSRELPRLVEVIIRALGVVPSIVNGSTSEAEQQSTSSSTRLYKWTKRLSRKGIVGLIALNVFALAVVYTALAIMEVYSKRSSLGCPYPIFILTWYLCAIFPAAVETIFRQVPQSSRTSPIVVGKGLSAVNGASHSSNLAHPAKGATASGVQLPTTNVEQRVPDKVVSQGRGIPTEDMSPVQGRGKPWLVQLLWAVYYIAGTLVYSSIMAVTVIELFVWVVISCATTAVSKLLAFFLCMALEKGRERARIRRN